MTPTPDIEPIREGLAREIYDKPTRFDGDAIGTHLSQSFMLDASAVNAEQLRAFVQMICEDAADACLTYLIKRQAFHSDAYAVIKKEGLGK